ncbi:MAG: hypothetical protein BWY05_01539 [Euryarchaeota archaeon ADurb.Bin165]|nr:MAG: hypothetical protein BWY05_01539 [Euryarchaeota archaeon ADurb.Bin165]
MTESANIIAEVSNKVPRGVQGAEIERCSPRSCRRSKWSGPTWQLSSSVFKNTVQSASSAMGETLVPVIRQI